MDERELDRLAEIIIEHIVKTLARELDGLKTQTTSGQGTVEIPQRLITAEAVQRILNDGINTIEVQPGAIITPLARDYLQERRIEIVRGMAPALSTSNEVTTRSGAKTIGLLAGSCTETEKRIITNRIQAHGLDMLAVEPKHRSPSGFDGAFARLSRDIAQQKLFAGIIVDESAFALKHRAGKLAGVRPAMCWDMAATDFCPKGHNSNMILINNRLLGFKKLEKILEAWLTSLRKKNE